MSSAEVYEERVDLAWWYPRIEAAGLPTPSTVVVQTPGPDLVGLLDGAYPEAEWGQLITSLSQAALSLGGAPFFLRTGYGSGKHQWEDTCYVRTLEALPRHVFCLVEWSHTVDLMGLPTSTWAVRELLQTAPVFTCSLFGGMPVVREVRMFATGSEVVHVQPYWPSEALEQGVPDTPRWREAMVVLNDTSPEELEHLGGMAKAAAAACGGDEWSVDFLYDRWGAWWLTDMAPGPVSFRYTP